MEKSTLPAFMAFLGLTCVAAAPAATLEVAAKIELPDCEGRIDHLAYDAVGERLFIAELGNNSVAIVDVKKGRLDRRLQGLEEPQGIAFFPELQRLYVANGGDGSIAAYDSKTFKLVNSRKLGGDADNIRIDAADKLVYVGHGEGAIAVLDASTLKPVGEIPLTGHPESFQLSPVDRHIYMNVPDLRQVVVGDLKHRRQIAAWPTKGWSANFPMAIDSTGNAVLTVFRKPAVIARYSMQGGAVTTHAEVCGDADDVFIDEKRNRVYVICGEGVVEVMKRETLERIDRVSTSPGARTGLFSAAADTLFVAARATGGKSAAIYALKPR
ncbi:MAG TPA: YncE family protein [Steroidobacteraceae bacterium]|nr:YncE family protein [Steroidobacteraceae bacterium]